MSRVTRWRALAAGGLSLAAIAFAVLVDPVPRLVWNGSASVPRGLYWVETRPPERGDLVLAELSDAALTLSVSRAYLPFAMPVVKRIAALEDDEICRNGPVISVNGAVRVEAVLRDLEGRLMPAWRGCRRLEPGEVFLLADHPHSFDGRYLGASKTDAILGVAHPVWTLGDGGSAIERGETAG